MDDVTVLDVLTAAMEMDAAQRELAAARSFFNNAEDERADEAIYRLRAAEERVNNLFIDCKRRGIGVSGLHRA